MRWAKCAVKVLGSPCRPPVHNDTLWFRTPCKDWDTLDLQACMIEQEMKPKSPEELYNALPMIKPQEFNDLFELTSRRNVRLQDGVDPTMVYSIVNKKNWLEMPEMQWNSIFAQFHVHRFHGSKMLPKAVAVAGVCVAPSHRK